MPAHTEVLPTGDTLVVVPDARAPLVEIRLLLPAGQASPWWLRSGAAAAWYLPMADAARRERVAAVMDLELSHDDWSTALVARTRRAELPGALEVLREMLLAEGVDRGTLRSWRRGLLAPPWSRRTDPRAALQAFVGRLLLPTGDPRRDLAPSLGLQAGRVRAAQALLTRLPSRVLGLAGEISVEEARQAAARILPPPLRRLPRGLAPVLPPQPAPPPADVGLREERARVPGQGRSWVLLARTGLALGDPEVSRLRLALHALAGAGRSRLYTRLRHDEGLIYALDAVPGIGPVPGVMLIATATSPRSQEAVAEATREVLARFTAEGMTATELSAAQAALALEAAIRDSDPARTLLTTMEAVRHGLPPTLAETQQARCAATTLAEENAFVRRFFAPEALVLVQALSGPDWWLE